MRLRVLALALVAGAVFSMSAFADFYDYNGDWRSVYLRDRGAGYYGYGGDWRAATRHDYGPGFYNYSGDWRETFRVGPAPGFGSTIIASDLPVLYYFPPWPMAIMPMDPGYVAFVDARGNSTFYFAPYAVHVPADPNDR